MSEIQAAFRQLGGAKLDEFSDDELTLFIGKNFPEFRKDPSFEAEYSTLKEDRDARIIHNLQLDIAGEETARARPTGKTLLDRMVLGVGSGVANLGRSAGATLTAADAFNLSPAMKIPAFKRGVESLTGRTRETEEELGQAGATLGGGLPGEFVQALGAGAVSLIPSVAGAFFGGIPGAMAVGGLMQFGDTYDEAVQSYVADGQPLEQAREQAIKPALLSGLVTAGLTSIGGAERFFARLGRGAIGKTSAQNILKEIFKASGLEGIEETADQFIQGFIARATFDPTKTFKEQLFESAMAGAVGMTLGAILPGASFAGRTVRRRISGRGQPPRLPAEEVERVEPVEQPEPIREGPTIEAEVVQKRIGDLFSSQNEWALSVLGKQVPINNITLNEDGTLTLDLNGSPVTLNANDMVMVEPLQLPAPGETQATEELPVEEELGQIRDQLAGELPTTQRQEILNRRAELLRKIQSQITEEVKETRTTQSPESTIPDPALRPEPLFSGVPPPPMEAINRWVDKAVPRRPGAPPVIQLDTSTPFPDLLPYDQAKATFTQPFGAGKVHVVGQALDPNARHITHIGEAVNTFHAEEAVGRSIASAFGIQVQGRWSSVFPVGDNGLVIGTDQAPGDLVEDLMRDPNSHPATDEQLTAVNEIKVAGDQVRALLTAHNIPPAVLTNDDGDSGAQDLRNYLPRIVLVRPGKKRTGGTGAGGLGGKAPFQKSRIFKTEKEGLEAEYEYEPNIERRFTSFVQRAYRKIAEKRMLDDLEKTPRQTKEAELRSQLIPRVAAGDLDVAGMEQRIKNALDEGTPDNRAFYGFVYPPEVVDELNRAFPNTTDFYSKYIAQANNFVKLLRLGYDLGVAFHQGLPLFYSSLTDAVQFKKSGLTWAKAQVIAMRSLADPETFARWARQPENLEAIRELSQLGAPIGRLPEFLAGAERGEFLEHPRFGRWGKNLGPVYAKAGRAADKAIGGTTRGFVRQFQTFLDVAKIELYKSQKDLVNPEEKLELARSIESVLMSGRMESIGVSRRQAIGERIAVLAPSYYRGAINLVAMVGQGGVSGRMARKAIGSYLVGGMATYVGIGLAMGMDWDEILERLVPTNGEFMNWRWELDNGTVLNFGLGGVMRSFMKTVAQMVALMGAGEWDRLNKLTSDENPLVRWYRAHAAPVPSLIWDLFSGEDYMGNPPGEFGAIGVIMEGLIPLPAESVIDEPFTRERTLAEKAGTFALEMTGLNVHQESFGRSRMAELNKISQEKHQKNFDELTVGQRSRMQREFEKTEVFEKRPELSPKLVEFIKEKEKETGLEMAKQMSPEAQKIIAQNNLRVPANFRFSVAGRQIILTEDERDRFQELIVEAASPQIERQGERMSKMDRDTRKEHFSKLMASAKARALAKLKRELGRKE